MAFKQSMASGFDRPDPKKCSNCGLNLLQLRLIQAEENRLKSNKVQQLLPHFKRSANQEGVISLSIDGQVQFITQQADQLLKQYFASCPPGSLPEALKQWFKQQISKIPFSEDSSPDCCLPLRIEQPGQRLSIHLVLEPIEDHYLLLLEEQKLQVFSVAALEVLGLTKREAEALFWIAKDKSNSGIARVLGCCEGTVRKHLENLYKKLGVQTRMGAVMVALEMLGLLQP